jgi:hypothetical protein
MVLRGKVVGGIATLILGIEPQARAAADEGND